MTANLLTLNSSRTECLLIGLKHQLAKIHNSPSNTTHSGRTLGFMFDEHICLIRSVFFLNLFLIFMNIAVSWIPQETSVAPLPPSTGYATYVVSAIVKADVLYL